MKKLILTFTLLFLAVGSYTIYRHRAKGTTADETQVPLAVFKKPEDKLTFCAWLPWWDFDNALREFNEKKTSFTSVNPFTFVVSPDGGIEEKIENISKLIKKGPNLELIPTISNELDGERISAILASKEKTESHISQIVDLVVRENFDGIEIDYEHLGRGERQKFSDFIASLSEELHNKGKKLSVTLIPRTEENSDWGAGSSQDWKKIGDAADYVKVMAYDYHWDESTSGPIAPLDWVKEVSEYAVTNIPYQKIILGIGTYGYEWERGLSSAESYTLLEIQEIIKKQKGIASYDAESESPYFKYERDGKNFTIWFEDEKSISQKLTLAKKYFPGVCIWRLGATPKGILKLFN